MYYEANNQLLFSPSDLIVYMESEFASWMERARLEATTTKSINFKYKPDDEDRLLIALQEKGNRHEDNFFENLKNGDQQVVEINSQISLHEQAAATVQAMHSGADIIYQARLRLGNFAGAADFLMKVSGKSKLGNFHYEAWDTKLARIIKPYFIIQLCCYSEMLNVIQGYLPNNIVVVLGNNDTIKLRTQDFYYYYLHLKQSFINVQTKFAHDNMPDPAWIKNYGRWSTAANDILIVKDHVSQVANITMHQIKHLHVAGISTLSALAESELDIVPKMQEKIFARLKSQAKLQVQSKTLDKPKYEVIQNDDNKALGLSRLPPSSFNDVYFDMEGYPLVEGGLEYLFGCCHEEGLQSTFIDWWAHNRQQEKQAFSDFIDWTYARWQTDPSMHIYHYGHYEITAIRRLMGEHGTHEHQVDQLLRYEVFVDLYSIIRHGLRIGETRYSIKNVEHIYRGHRVGDITDAGTSVAFYENWREQPDGESWQTSGILDHIRKYNKDDCESTLECVQWLRQVQQDAGIEWVGFEPNSSLNAEEQQTASKITQLRDNLLDHATESDDSLSHMLANVLEFHHREDKPVWWRYFDRIEKKTDEELSDDIDCLAGLVRTSTPPKTIKQSLCYEYKFDPQQFTKLTNGSSCIVAQDPECKPTLDEIDEKKGLAYIKIGKNKKLPNYISLIPSEYISSKSISEAITEYVQQWQQGNITSGAVYDFLQRRRPNILNNSTGALLKNAEAVVNDTITLVKQLQNSTLAIQGPPGAGKTYTASHIIFALLNDGKRIAITSNSHKAIDNLMLAVLDVMTEQGEYFKMAKVQGKGYEKFSDNEKIQFIASMGKSDSSIDKITLWGGTAWTFVNEKAIDQFDYLFVDEAGQVAVANLIAMGRCTKNIVLLGDQMQLNQPIQGSHPGESGQSCLEYLLQDYATVPEDLGVFLPSTWRMHPSICQFISDAIYEGKLHAEAHTKNRIIEVPQTGVTHITKSAGLVYVPVEHEGNAQTSDEEISMIQSIVKDLLGRTLYDANGNPSTMLSLQDILFVAPYNYQVRKLQTALGEEASVGSVDKFQGQEAPVVILSMCASRVEDAPRGMSFLLDKNRMNVAISRAQCLAIVVGSPHLVDASVKTVEQMKLLNLYCRIIVEANVCDHPV